MSVQLCSSGLQCFKFLSIYWQGKRHQQNMAKRAAREAVDKPAQPQPQRRAAVKKTVKIGRPGYRVTKQFDPEADQRSLLFQVRPSRDPRCVFAGPGLAEWFTACRSCQVASVLLWCFEGSLSFWA